MSVCSGDFSNQCTLSLILIIILIIFGPGKLSGLGDTIGKAIKGFKQAMNEPDKKPEEDAKKLTIKRSKRKRPIPL
ncbi:MAG: hypothetical protein CVU71_13585 [Deltaproteobacteria bacterium HGW-Deltaproteobacteria-6]|jgi:sec-independent protein translocase protein TatA|nr:MAG: hypothetical protein CVU71_13585 [Deltaproteobacteria bacterium HGW-Deltaproteobacteria-6]